MEDTIKLKSRYRARNYLERVQDLGGIKSKTYALKTDTSSFRVGETNKGDKFIDPSGGPMIVVGSYLEEAEAVVKSIDYIIGYGYTITFE
jgi:hypothetical protein